MKKFFLTILFLALSFQKAYALVEGIVEPIEGKKLNLIIGDSIDLKISFWPKDLKLFKDIKKLEGTSFLNIFYVLDVNKFEISKNNYDVINIFIKAIVLKPYKRKPFTIWNNGLKNIPIDIRNITVDDLKGKEKKITYYSINYNKVFNHDYFHLIGLALLIFILFIIFKIFRNKRTKHIKV